MWRETFHTVHLKKGFSSHALLMLLVKLHRRYVGMSQCECSSGEARVCLKEIKFRLKQRLQSRDKSQQVIGLLLD